MRPIPAAWFRATFAQGFVNQPLSRSALLRGPGLVFPVLPIYGRGAAPANDNQDHGPLWPWRLGKFRNILAGR